jgi:CO/xanthine dehydrogenase FAD-binding subunit
MRQVRLPQTLADLWSLLNKDPTALIFSGGTDLFVKMRADKVAASTMIGLERLAALRDIREDNGDIRIGACATHENILRHPLIAAHLPVLVQALRTLGSPPIRTMGTIGGNICTASPAGDTLPPLYVLRAEVEIASSKGSRSVPIPDFIAGPGQIRLAAGEIVTGVRVKKPAEFNLHHFEKVGQRKSMSCAVAGMAALLRVTPSGAIEACRLAWGSVGPTVMTDAGIENFLTGKILSPDTLSAAARQVTRMVMPIDDVRATADYRRTVSGNLLLRLSGMENPTIELKRQSPSEGM